MSNEALGAIGHMGITSLILYRSLPNLRKSRKHGENRSRSRLEKLGKLDLDPDLEARSRSQL